MRKESRPEARAGRAKILAMRFPLLAFVLMAGACALPAASKLEVYVIDVEGGQAILFSAPGGESLLVDTGWGGFNKRDANRIVAAARDAGVKKIDYLVVTHYHSDHVGGVPQLAERIRIRNFVDHGDNTDTGRPAEILFNAYASFRAKGNHIQAKPGDTIPVKGIVVRVLSSGGDLLQVPLPGAGQRNPECTGVQKHDPDAGENARSIGILVTFGDFRLLDLGDLTWNKEHDLACPVDKIGPVDLYLVTHRGSDQSNPPQLVHAVKPRVAIMNNSARKGGTPAAWQTVRDSPGLLDLWQLHFAVAGGREHNSSDTLIANLEEICEGKWLKITAQRDGTFTVYNSRNRYLKTYPRQ
jgi:competence protein ComEC